jgi:hypothetical protein
MIAFACPTCEAPIKVADELAGRTGKCSKCGGRMVVPGPSEAVAARASVDHHESGRPADGAAPSGVGREGWPTDWPDEIPDRAPESAPAEAPQALDPPDARPEIHLAGCPHCAGLVSTAAWTCPHCGAPLLRPKVVPVGGPRFNALRRLSTWFIVLGWLAFVLALLLIVYAVFAAVSIAGAIFAPFLVAQAIMCFFAWFLLIMAGEGIVLALTVEEHMRAIREQSQADRP